jgi:hypothetical protein
MPRPAGDAQALAGIADSRDPLERPLTDVWLNITVSLATLGYFLVLSSLIVRAWRFPATPRQTFLAHHILQPRRFSPEGEGPRRTAMRFMTWGGLVVIGLWVWAMNA